MDSSYIVVHSSLFDPVDLLEEQIRVLDGRAGKWRVLIDGVVVKLGVITCHSKLLETVSLNADSPAVGREWIVATAMMVVTEFLTWNSTPKVVTGDNTASSTVTAPPGTPSAVPVGMVPV